jgi:long-chain acyl-CoA synthetase
MISDTFPKYLLENTRKYPHAVAMRRKKFGIWNRITWEECYRNIKGFAVGLASLGLQRGDKVCILGDNDPEWFWAAVAVECMGAVPVGLYIDSTPPEVQYIAEHSDSVFAIAKDQEQTDKFLEIKEKLPKLKNIIYWDPRGMWAYKENPWTMDFKEVIALGGKFEKDHPDFFEESISKGCKSDLACICYTSGTTGLPKGCMIGYDMLIEGIGHVTRIFGLKENDEYLSFVSPAWAAEWISGIAGWLAYRFRTNFPETPETVVSDLREIGVSFLVFGPRQWENLLSIVQIRISDTTWIRRMVYNISLPIGYKTADYVLNKRCAPPFFWKLIYQAANLVCFRSIRDYLGLKKLKMGVTSGSAFGPDAFHWFQAIGVNMAEIYGMSEALPLISHGKDLKVGTIGRPTPGVEVKISDEGEMLVRPPVAFKGYYKNPEATSKKWVNGWLKTGDACLIDEEGHVVYLDRVEDLLELKGGSKYSASYIENRLKFSPYIKDVMVVGGLDKAYLFAIFNIDFDNVGRWAEKNRIPYTTYEDLSQKPEVYDLIQKEITKVNGTLPENARVRKFVNLPKEFDPDEGEMTRTRKIKRVFMEQRNKDIIDAAYKGERVVPKKVEVKYRDGRVGTVISSITIRAMEE